MPRYFFNVYDHEHKPDPDGTDLSDASAAHIEGVILAGYLLQDHAAKVLRCDDWHLTVTDTNGAILFRLDLSATTNDVPPASNVYAFG